MPPQPASRQDVESLRQDLRLHLEDDRKFQERLFEYLGDEFRGVNARIGTLWDENNRRIGAEAGRATAAKGNQRITGLVGAMLNVLIASVTAYAAVKALK